MPNRLAKLDATAGNLTLLGKQTVDDFQKQYRRRRSTLSRRQAV